MVAAVAAYMAPTDGKILEDIQEGPLSPCRVVFGAHTLMFFGSFDGVLFLSQSRGLRLGREQGGDLPPTSVMSYREAPLTAKLKTRPLARIAWW